MSAQFLENTKLISYSAEGQTTRQFAQVEDIHLNGTQGQVNWLNTYGLYHQEAFRKMVSQHGIDDFVLKMLSDTDHSNKVIELNDILFVAITVLKTESETRDTEQMYFMITERFIWSIQEKSGDYFGWIRDRIANNKGIVRNKQTDYLFYLILESIVDNYTNALQRIKRIEDDAIETADIEPTPEFTALVGSWRSRLFQIKKSASSLRDTIGKLAKVKSMGLKSNYFAELLEQNNQLLSDVEFELQELDSKINLIFSIQGHRLNQVMKTLTIFSVVFIPLTFITGFYGMNFEFIPGLHHPYGYYLVMGVMGLIALSMIIYLRLRKWF